MRFRARLLFFSSLLLVTSSLHGQESATLIQVSGDYLLVEHTNKDLNGEELNSEKGWLPGVQVAISHKSKRMIGTFSAEKYSGNASFEGQASNGAFVSDTFHDLTRLTYRLDSNQPWQTYQFYGAYSFNNWHRNVESRGNVSGINRQYQWSTMEAGVRLGLYASRKTVANADIGVSRSFFSKMLINLREHNLGKPLLRLKDKFGFAATLGVKHMFNRKHGVNLCVKARYWQFGVSDIRAVENEIEKVEVREPESKTLNTAVSASYLYIF